MKKLTWTTEKRTINNLIPFEKNPRCINDLQLKNLKKSITRFNLVEIPAIDTDGTILAGHQRLKVMQLLGRGNEEIDVRIPNRKLTDTEREQYLLTSNAVTGDWDMQLLREFNVDLLADVGFDKELLDDIFKEIQVQAVVDEITKDTHDDEKEYEPITKKGDIIQLGRHRLICGDSTKKETIQELCNGKKVSMIMSDPVYNINLDYNKGVGGKQSYGAEVTDTRTDDEYIKFLGESMEAALSVAKDDAHIFYWNTEEHIWIIQTLYRELGITNKRVCLWIKNGHNPTPSVAFNKCYEPCVYGVRGKPYLSSIAEYSEVLNPDIANGNAGHESVNLWVEKRLSSSEYEHATSKPPSVYERAIKRCTQIDDIILDSFGGSGSTLLAAEQLGRTAYLAELEPVFCDIICRRFETLTGIKRKLIRNYAKV